MPGLIKIGKTTTSPNQRMSELHSTGVPTPFVLELSVEVHDCHASERATHSALAKYRVANNREFFRTSVKAALEAMLPVIGEYKIHEVQSSHGVKEIERELHRRRLDALEAERRAEARRAEMRLFQEIEEKKRLNELEDAIRAENQKLQQLGPRPIKKELPGIGIALWAAFFPIPFGWMVWLCSLNIFDPKGQTVGLVCILLLIGGYIAHKTSNKYEEEFDRLNKPFVPIDNRLYEFKSEIDKIDKIKAKNKENNSYSYATARSYF
jgi:T5orf172 domain